MKPNYIGTIDPTLQELLVYHLPEGDPYDFHAVTDLHLKKNQQVILMSRDGSGAFCLCRVKEIIKEGVGYPTYVLTQKELQESFL